jgi:hypothetical protein
MDQMTARRIENDPNYQKLVSERKSLGWTLAIITPHALLHRRQRQGGAQVGVLGDHFYRYFYILTFIIGFGAIVLVSANLIYHVGRDIKPRSSAAATCPRSISPMPSVAT